MPRERDNSKVLRAIWELQRVIDPKRVALREAAEELAEARAQSEALAEALEEIADGYERHNPGWWIKRAKAALRAYRSSQESSDAS